VVVMIPYIQFLITADAGFSFFLWTTDYPVYFWIIGIGWEFCVFAYLIATIVLLIRYQGKLPAFFSSLKRKQLNWLLYLTIGFLGYLMVAVIIMVLRATGVLTGPGDGLYLSVFILVIYMLGIGIFGYRQRGIFSGYMPDEISNEQLSSTFRKEEHSFKYEKSGLHDKESQQLLQAITRLIQEKKPYLDPELNLQQLADQLNTTLHKLSQVINEQFKQNFYDFINTYRVKEVEKKLRDTRFNHLKVMAIAYDCGFNSKSAFYASFRKSTGMTPVEYRRKTQPEREPIFVN
jgi:AraC-like DNA-binding protein